MEAFCYNSFRRYPKVSLCFTRDRVENRELASGLFANIICPTLLSAQNKSISATIPNAIRVYFNFTF